MAQVTEGALDETSSILQRIRMLAIQSATDSYIEKSYLDVVAIVKNMTELQEIQPLMR